MLVNILKWVSTVEYVNKYIKGSNSNKYVSQIRQKVSQISDWVFQISKLSITGKQWNKYGKWHSDKWLD